MAKRKSESFEPQVAALPVRIDKKGRVEVLVITSRDTGRWVIPKGWPMSGRKDHQAALIEAFEEAGVRGKVGKNPLGTYDYVKVMPPGEDDVDVRVTVYPMTVREVLKRWPERRERERDWVSPGDAAARVDEAELKDILLGLANQLDLAS
jgi:8-oxo-dGTP pyrophosphatase MutT (NUDIX family)